ncbi:MAG: ATP-binding protein [Oscillospiraceae bacterium]|nr:ATP-binding protein [Oscillospiraceae bacterium]
MNITTGKIPGAQKCVIYGPEGIGKSTFAAKFPEPIFIDTEGSTKHLDVRRFECPALWSQLLDMVRYVVEHPLICKTLVIDTADWAEKLCTDHVCATKGGGKGGIEDFGYGKGYTYLAEEFGRLLSLLESVVAKGIHVVMTAHARLRKIEQPDEQGAYDHWEMKLSKSTAPMLKEWCDLLLFCNYKTLVTHQQNGANKATGGKRVMYTSHHPAWDAKNRHELRDELPLDFAPLVEIFSAPAPAIDDPLAKLAQRAQDFDEIITPDEAPPPDPLALLREQLAAAKVTEAELRGTVGTAGIFSEDVPLAAYPADFVQYLLGNWATTLEKINSYKAGDDLPF